MAADGPSWVKEYKGSDEHFGCDWRGCEGPGTWTREVTAEEEAYLEPHMKDMHGDFVIWACRKHKPGFTRLLRDRSGEKA